MSLVDVEGRHAGRQIEEDMKEWNQIEWKHSTLPSPPVPSMARTTSDAHVHHKRNQTWRRIRGDWSAQYLRCRHPRNVPDRPGERSLLHPGHGRDSERSTNIRPREKQDVHVEMKHDILSIKVTLLN